MENTITKLRKYGRYLGNPKLKDKEAERLADTVFREADDMEHRQEFLMGVSEHQSFIDMVLGTSWTKTWIVRRDFVAVTYVQSLLEVLVLPQTLPLSTTMPHVLCCLPRAAHANV